MESEVHWIFQMQQRLGTTTHVKGVEDRERAVNCFGVEELADDDSRPVVVRVTDEDRFTPQVVMLGSRVDIEVFWGAPICPHELVEELASRLTCR